MNIGKSALLKVIFTGLSIYVPAFAVPAFPGAEGYGAHTVGGRDGRVIKVTTLDDSGGTPVPGSFRYAATRSGPRIVVFEVSGIIVLATDLKIKTPYLTIAGQTSPGGICLAGHQLYVNTHDVIMTHMRVRVGTQFVDYDRDADGNIIYYDEKNIYPVAAGGCQGNGTITEPGVSDGWEPCPFATGYDPELLDNMNIVGPHWGPNDAYNIIVDHCSFSWGVDECFTVTGGVTDMTVSWCVVAEGLSHAGHSKGEHSKGLMVVSYEGDGDTNTVSLHHNYIAHNKGRNPLITAKINSSTTADVVNNVVYNWHGALAPMGQEAAKINWVYNYARPGPNSNDWSREIVHWDKGVGPMALLYVHGNIGSTRSNQSEPDWNVGDYYYNADLSTDWQTDARWPAPAISTEEEMSLTLAEDILLTVGATVPVRDTVDIRVIDDFYNGTGKIRNNVTYPDDYPVFSAPAPPADGDNDGMPDTWEAEHGLNPGDSTDINGRDLDAGYANIEMYINELAGYITATRIGEEHRLESPGSMVSDAHPDPFSLYPNPSTGLVYVDGSSKTFSVYDHTGQPVKTFSNVLVLDEGVYLVKPEDGRTVRRLVVVK